MARPSNRTTAIGVAVVALPLLLGGAVLWRFDPVQYGFYPRCQFYTMTGLQCPGCGGLRAIHALLHGHLKEAFRLNALFIAALPIVTALLIRWLLRRRQDPAARFALPTHWLWIGLAAAWVFGIARNLPCGLFARLGG